MSDGKALVLKIIEFCVFNDHTSVAKLALLMVGESQGEILEFLSVKLVRWLELMSIPCKNQILVWKGKWRESLTPQWWSSSAEDLHFECSLKSECRQLFYSAILKGCSRLIYFYRDSMDFLVNK